MRSKIFFLIVCVIGGLGLVFVGLHTIKGKKAMLDTPVTGQHTNRLINETSPYLLQHADNPVNWYPWGPEAFERAKKEDKPIFLSIGYSTCHWCHVMEHESFENDRIAKILNDNFISIKVDREQRPDVDGIYMRAVQAMTGSGGWPLSVFLTSTGQPFYGGTYFPPEDRYGRPGFDRVLLNIAKAWGDRRGELVGAAERLSELLADSADSIKEKQLSPAMLERAFKYSLGTFDSANGGFGTAPKFPQPTNFLMLLSYWYRTGDDRALQMVEKTLDSMAKGGIYDHVGGGFHRYSTDARWLVPHFEKMLYDQALISRVYLQAYQITNKRQYARIATEIFEYVLRDMTDDAGGFYSAEDADSEGKEGTFYVWDSDQIASVLDDKHAGVFNAYYGVTKKGNFEHGKSILNVAASIEQLEKKFGIDSAGIERVLANARSEVFKQREKRIRPLRDDKVIAGWNGLMISSLANGGAVLGQERFTAAAERAAEFVLTNMHKDGRLRRYYRLGRAVGDAFVDDYAFMILAMVDLYHASFNPKWLIEANQLAEEMIELFGDDEQGGFFFAGKDGEKLIARPKPYVDSAIPAGNSAAGLALLKLGSLTMNENFTKLGFGVLEAFSNQLEQAPAHAPTMLVALSFGLGPSQEIVLAGDLKAEDTKEMLKLIRGKFLPTAVLLFHPQGPGGSAIEGIAAFIKNQTPIDGKATVYLCENYACKAPINDPAVLSKMLSSISGAK